MRPVRRSLVLPLLACALPGLWYVNRNLTTASLPPRREPTTWLVLGGAIAAVGGAAVVAAAAVALAYAVDARTGGRLGAALPERLRRTLSPDGSTLLALPVVVVGLAALASGAGMLARLLPLVGPTAEFVVTLGAIVVAAFPVGLLLPMLVQHGTSTTEHVLFWSGLALTVVWWTFLSTLAVDAVRRLR